jgi:hypothetical protein
MRNQKMTVVIQFKSPERTLVRSSFEMEMEEVQRLINDFENYKMGGKMRCGTYRYQLRERDGYIQKKLVLDFDYLKNISCQLQGATN